MTFAATLIVVGRFLLGLMFIVAGIRNFSRMKERSGARTNYGFALPMPLVLVGFTVQLVGGLSVALGLWPFWGALALIAFLVPATAFYHNLFMFRGKEREPHIYFVTVNLALAGAFLLVIAVS
ncbi:MAG: DoxX family protein [Devosia sp.]